MLDRYKKPGGFMQLIKLLESFPPPKQDKFLSLIEVEDKRWSDCLRSKLLSMERIFSWEDAVLGEIIPKIPEKTFTTAFMGLPLAHQERVNSRLSHAEKRRMGDQLHGFHPSESEIVTARAIVIEITRDMFISGALRLEHIDKELLIAENIEETIQEQPVPEDFNNESADSEKQIFTNDTQTRKVKSASEAVTGAPPQPPQLKLAVDRDTAATTSTAKSSNATAAANRSTDVETLRMKISSLLQEIKDVKNENKILRGKLDAIRKLA